MCFCNFLNLFFSKEYVQSCVQRMLNSYYLFSKYKSKIEVMKGRKQTYVQRLFAQLLKTYIYIYIK